MPLVISLYFPGQRPEYICRGLVKRLTLREFTELARRFNALRHGGHAEVVGTPFEIAIRSSALGADEMDYTRRQVNEILNAFEHAVAAA